VTLPAFAAERRRLQHSARSAPAAITDIFCLHSAQQQTRRPPLLLSADETDQSCPLVGLTCVLGWVGSGSVEIFQFLVGWVGSKKVLKL